MPRSQRRCASVELESALLGGASMGNPVATLTPPVIDGWEILRPLDVGGMGEVWYAQSTSESSPAAIKLPSTAQLHRPHIAERFETESETLASLDHPNVLQVIDAGTAEDGRLFLALEYVDGCDLRRLLRGQRLPTERALDIWDHVSEAVIYTHSQGFVHRDLKPANILVAEDGTLKLADFGLARNVQDETMARPTSEGDGLGTPYYLAPESMRQASSADERADVYALGVLLYELLTGAIPQGVFTPLSKHLGFARAWDTLLAEALHDDPDKRLKSAAALRDAVMRLRQREARRQALRKYRGPFLAGALVAGLSLLAIGWFFLWPKPKHYPKPSVATIQVPWANSLGMPFVPVEGKAVLMAETETTIAQFSAFYRFDNSMAPEWRADEPGKASASGTVIMLPSGWELVEEATPLKPGYETGPDHPITGITMTDAWAFCTWLTMKERAEGRLTDQQRYRLPYC